MHLKDEGIFQVESHAAATDKEAAPECMCILYASYASSCIRSASYDKNHD